RVVEVLNARVNSTAGASQLPGMACTPAPAGDKSYEADTATLWHDGAAVAAPVYRFDAIPVTSALQGPALISDSASTIVLQPGWTAEREASGTLVLKAGNLAAPQVAAASTDCDPVRLEVFNHLFMSIAEQMGGALQRTSHST